MRRKSVSKKDKWLLVGCVLLLAAFIAIYMYTTRKQAPAPEPVVAEEPEPTPDESLGEVEAIEAEDIEEKSELPPLPEPVALPTSGVFYSNNERMTVMVHDDQTLSLGVEAPELTDGIYLDPVYYFGLHPDDRYMFYLSTKFGKLEFSNTEYVEANLHAFPGQSSFAIMNRTYDTLVPIPFESAENYGVRWVFDETKGVEYGEEDIIYIRAVSVERQVLLGAARAYVTYNPETNAYALSKMESSDVMYTGEVPMEVREATIDDTLRFFTEGTDEFDLGFWDYDLLQQMRPYATVEVVPTPYFDQLYTMESNPMRRYVLDGYTILAVNYPYTGFGVLTAYFIPEFQVYSARWDYEPVYVDRTGVETIIPFWIVGYDALMPFTHQTFIDNVFQDDVEFFETDFEALIADKRAAEMDEQAAEQVKEDMSKMSAAHGQG